jgi:hypothetical protein
MTHICAHSDYLSKDASLPGALRQQFKKEFKYIEEHIIRDKLTDLKASRT